MSHPHHYDAPPAQIAAVGAMLGAIYGQPAAPPQSDPHAPTTRERISERLMEASRQLYALPECVTPALDDAYVAIGDAIILTTPRLHAVMDVNDDAQWLLLDAAIEYAARKLEPIDCPAAVAFVRMARELSNVEAKRVEAASRDAVTLAEVHT